MKLLYPLLLMVGLFAPGWLLGRALRTSAGWITAFIGSLAIFTNLLILLDSLRVPLTQVSLSIGLAIICSTLAIIARWRDGATEESSGRKPTFRAKHGTPEISKNQPSPSPDANLAGAPSPAPYWCSRCGFALAALVGLVAIAGKATIHPLSGYDTFFRWDFLARQLFRLESLDFYPAVSGSDFHSYGWCDGIAPLVSGMYFWSYVSWGETVPLATTPIVSLQAIFLFAAVYQLATLSGGAKAGLAAAAILAGSSVLLWGVAMGQETGLTALALTTMFLCLERSRRQANEAWLIWAGISAAVGALAREYGLIFIAIGALDLALRRVRPRHWLLFGSGALVFSLPWYFRNWVRTGNPLWPHDLGSLFATNKLHNDYMGMVAAHLGIGTASAPLGRLLFTALGLMACPILLGACGFVQSRRRAAEYAAVLLIVLLWLYSIGQTSAGATYSLRVLTPVLALCAVAGGQFLAQWSNHRRAILAAIVLTVVAVDAAGRSNFVDAFPFIPWWRVPWASWVQPRDASVVWSADRTWPVLAAAAGSEKLIVSDPFEHAALAKLGAQPVPLFSPEIAFLFDPNSDYERCLRQLHESHFRFILLSTNPGINTMILPKYPFFRTLEALSPTVATASVIVYDLSFLNPQTSMATERALTASSSTGRP